MYWGNYIYIFSDIWEKISSKKTFLWKNENDQKKDCSPWVLCQIASSFDCDHTHIHNTKDPNIEKTCTWT